MARFHPVVADPRRPYKSYVAAAVAVATVLLGAGLDMPAWAVAVASAIATGGAVYLKRNPLMARPLTARPSRN